ncbi:uncharacterized protein TRIADDRAFT_64064 [Trichoplax adhaerens]|uniref:Expressed protein n=1 Tax=Trichoplax adhaerens TaxID=10228 RepID=B3S1T0_TRIAD|nr:expressed protein [Trichoplax adhaerens]EDV23028.1 expressed protein [Trichoplax adhaerens]|eukprot:XP_002113938.1 expressed protein [Trichoplax adhaerens]
MPQYSYPFIYIQNVYVNVVNQAVHYFRIQWGFLITSPNHDLIAVQSGPEVMIAIEEIEDGSNEKQISERQRPVERTSKFTGWLECISYHTGLPVWLVCATLLTSVFALIGLCCIWVYDSDDESDNKKQEAKCRTLTKQPIMWSPNKSIPADIIECKQPLLIDSSVVKVPLHSNL